MPPACPSVATTQTTVPSAPLDAVPFRAGGAAIVLGHRRGVAQLVAPGTDGEPGRFGRTVHTSGAPVTPRSTAYSDVVAQM